VAARRHINYIVIIPLPEEGFPIEKETTNGADKGI
jgi:hypothetical protein